MKLNTKGKLPRGTVNLLLGALFILALVIFFEEIFLKKGYFWEDFLEQNYPYRLFAARALKDGIFPFWNPYIFGGLPFFADIQTGVLFFPNLILNLFVTSDRWLSGYIVEVFIILHLLIAGFGMFYFARENKLSDITAIYMGLVYMLNGHFIVHLTHTQQLQTLVFIPFIYLFLKRTFENTNIFSFWSASIASGLLLGTAGLAGYPQIIVIILVGFFLIAVYYLIVIPKQWRRIVLGSVITLSIFTLIVACQYVPSYFLFKDSIRGLYTYEEIVEGSFHPLRFVTFLVPNYFGSTAQGQIINFWGPGNYYQYWEQMVYIGIIPIILCGFAFAKNTRKNTLLPLILIIVPLLIGLGKYFPLHILLYKYLPFFKDIRTPAKFLNLTIFGLVWLSGIGLENLINLKPRAKYLNLVCSILGLFLLGLTFFVPNFSGKSIALGDIIRVLLILAGGTLVINLYLKKVLKLAFFGSLIIIIAFLDLFTFGYKYNSSPIEPDFYWRDDQLTAFFRREAQKEFVRVNIRSPEGMILPRNIGYVLEFPTVDGYNPLTLLRFSQARSKLSTERFFSLMSVKYFTYFDTSNRRLNIKQNESYLPRAQLYYNWEVIPDPESLLVQLNNPNFPIDKKIILETPLDIPNTTETQAQGIAKITYFSLNNIKLSVESSQPGILVLRDNYYPNWQVKVNGQIEKVFPVNYFLRGCIVPAGKSTVEFFYKEKYFAPLLVISVMTIILSLGMLVLIRYKSLRPNSALITDNKK
ncbi:MAG: hypothetical protein NZ601_01280 [candidate division WOR-3 bacterium]|nr:hypothetical protein [candidate division WOR-3 bacterium]MDW7987504.1 hypothetical protein [candidate division WOR-3 bacterium]